MIRHQDGEMGRESAAAAAEEEEEEEVREREKRMERAPVDDVCPICFDDFVYPCRGPCGHWYCGGCILLYWNHVAALQPCKCPMCSQKITRLIPEASLNCCVNDDVLENVKKYNLLFVGGMYGFFRKVVRLPLFVKKVFDEGNPHRYHILRFFVTTLGVIYCTSQCNFLPKAMNSVQAFDVAFTVLVLILQIVAYFYRWLRRQQVRRLQLL